MKRSLEVAGFFIMTRDEFSRRANETRAKGKNQRLSPVRAAAAASARAIITSIPDALAYADYCSVPKYCVMRVIANLFNGNPEVLSLKEQSDAYWVYTFCEEHLVRPHFVRLPDGAALMMMHTEPAYAKLQAMLVTQQQLGA
jgi:hypothetical protein